MSISNRLVIRSSQLRGTLRASHPNGVHLLRSLTGNEVKKTCGSFILSRNILHGRCIGDNRVAIHSNRRCRVGNRSLGLRIHMYGERDINANRRGLLFATGRPYDGRAFSINNDGRYGKWRFDNESLPFRFSCNAQTTKLGG